MEQIEMLLNEYILYIIAGLGGLIVILLILVCVNISNLRKLKNRYEKFMDKEDINLEELLVQYTKKLNVLLQNEKEMQTSIEHMEKVVKDCVQKVGVVRYQAIPNMGADLSYTVALLDEKNDGVVFNGIYGRDGCYTYAKPIKDGKSTYNLSEEEEEAIEQAIKKGSIA
ncbi:MAG: DUF4446 family protein [Cellulosilyticum sp.]|nr:DUF4446 family protein [Cellulosilyticum sp.]